MEEPKIESLPEPGYAEGDDLEKTLARMSADPKWFMESLLKIRGKEAGELIPLKLNNFQVYFLNALMLHRLIACLKARQMGSSTLAVAFLTWIAMTQQGENCMIIGYSAALAAELLDKVKVFIESMPASLRPTLKYSSKSEIVFQNMRSKIQVIASDRAGRGYSPSQCLLTELPFIERQEEKLTALMGALPKTGRLILETTPGPVGDLFHRIWTDDTNGFHKVEAGWWWLYSQEEMDAKKAQMKNLTGSDDKFEQEFGLEFGVAGKPFFDPKLIRRMRRHQLSAGDEVSMNEEGTEKWTVREEPDGLRVYRPPEAGKLYVVSGDEGQGIRGGDYSVVMVFNKHTGEEVAFWRGHVPPDRLGEKMAEWGYRYNTAMLVPEANPIGVATVLKIKELIYPNIYFRPARYDTVDTPNSDRLGWLTSSRTRELMLTEFRAACDSGEILVHSKEVMNEMSVFVVDDLGRPGAIEGQHDDCVLSASIAVQGLKAIYTGPVSAGLDWEKLGVGR